MRYLFCLLMLLCSVTVFSQIKTLEVVEDKVTKPVPIYDGTVNCLPEKDLEQYIGQVFYMPKSTDKAGYLQGRFYVKNLKMKKKAHVLIDSKYFLDAMGKYYDVVGVEDINTYALHRYLLLKDKEDGAVFYYRYSERSFPFIVVSYFEKTRKKMVGDTLHFKGYDINAYSLDEKQMGNSEMASFVCTDYVLDETGKNRKEVLLLESDSIKLKIPMERAIANSKSDMAFNFYIEDKKYSAKISKYNEEAHRREKANIEKTFSEANKLIGTTIYPFKYSGYCWAVDSVGAEKGDESICFEINTSLRVVHVGKDENDKFNAILYFTTVEDKLYMRSVSFHSDAANDYFHRYFSTVDIRKQHKNISDRNWNLVKQGKLELGMTMDECEVARGLPDSISTVETAQGYTSLWIYSYSSLYFVNGRLVAIQK